MMTHLSDLRTGVLFDMHDFEKKTLIGMCASSIRI
jgi:hypothetical protein